MSTNEDLLFVVSDNSEESFLLALDTETGGVLAMGQSTTDDISVGQRITVFGTITNDAVSELQLSAANGYARMQLSGLRGHLMTDGSTAPYPALTLTTINGRNVAIYDFAGTGQDAGSDADPDFYELDSGTLGLENFAPNDAVAALGFPTRFGSAPPDFSVQTLSAAGAH